MINVNEDYKRQQVKWWLRAPLSLRFWLPSPCVICGRGDTELCVSCAGQLAPKWRSRSLVGLQVMAVGRYEEPAWQQLVRQVKSYQSRALLWAVLAADSLPNWARGASFVPVPTSRWHFARRGFNQAEEIAAVLADLAGGQLLAAAREAWRRRVSHVMTEAERRTERRLFRRSCQPDQLAGQPVVLVDDVLTTGTTLLKLAEWLRRQGADVQGALVLGTVPLRRR